MNEDKYIYKGPGSNPESDGGPSNNPLDPKTDKNSENLTNKDALYITNKFNETKFKETLFKRTVGTALISALVTFVFTCVLFAYLAFAVFFPVTSLNGSGLSFDSKPETRQAVIKVNEIISNLKSSFVTKLTDEEILQAIAQGLPSSLNNPYTYYLTKEQYNQITEDMSGEYVGIGCTVTVAVKGRPEIAEVVKGSPAEKAGLKIKDVFVSIDGVKIKETDSIESIVAKVKGKENTPVKLEIFRESTKTSMQFTIVRKTITYENVISKMLSNKVGYIHIKAFAGNVDKDFIEAMDDLQKKGARNIVFDLRYNSGGDAAVMTNMLEYLLPKGTLLATIKGRENNKDFKVDWIAKKQMKVPATMRYAILTNSYSASASEFFTGCLRDHGKAIIVGEKTFGKGSGTSLFKLSDGSAVNITIFKYYLPKGDSVEGKGISPTYESRLPEKYTNTSVEDLPVDEDTVLAKAMEELHKFGETSTK
jgi:carboxyl-terminal processing protease